MGLHHRDARAYHGIWWWSIIYAPKTHRHTLEISAHRPRRRMNGWTYPADFKYCYWASRYETSLDRMRRFAWTRGCKRCKDRLREYTHTETHLDQISENTPLSHSTHAMNAGCEASYQESICWYSVRWIYSSLLEMMTRIGRCRYRCMVTRHTTLHPWVRYDTWSVKSYPRPFRDNSISRIRERESIFQCEKMWSNRTDTP